MISGSYFIHQFLKGHGFSCAAKSLIKFGASAPGEGALHGLSGIYEMAFRRILRVFAQARRPFSPGCVYN
jgi:hypothetical protein